MAVLGLAARGDRARGGVQRGEQRGRAVADVVRGAALDQVRPHGLDRRGAVQGLDLGLLLDAEHDGVLRRVQVEPTTSTTLASSSGSVEKRNPSDRQGWMPYSRQTRATVALPMPSFLDSAREDQCVNPVDFAGGASVAAITLALSTRRGRPDRSRSARPSSP